MFRSTPFMSASTESHSTKNANNQDDPRAMDAQKMGPYPQAGSYETGTAVAKLSRMRSDYFNQKRLIPSENEIAEAGASVEELLYELWEKSYKETIEPTDVIAGTASIPLTEMSTIRRAKCERWRKVFITCPLSMLRQAPDQTSSIIQLVQSIWRDIFELQQAGW